MTVKDKKQVSVSYIGDLDHTPPDDVLLVEGDEDYVWACKKLSPGDSSSAGLNIWVRSKNHFAWLQDFIE